MITLHVEGLPPAALGDSASIDTQLRGSISAENGPTLITLRTSNEMLRIGVGHDTGDSVALFLDRAAEPWHAVGPCLSIHAASLEFRSGSSIYSFDGELRIPEADTRAAARQFIETATRPDLLAWRREQRK